MRKRLLSFLTAAAMMLGCVACAGGSEKEVSENNSSEAETVLTIPTFFCGENVGRKYFSQSVERFNEKYAGTYRIEIEEVVEATYTEKMQQLAQAGDIPPLVHDLQTEFINNILIANDMYSPVNDILEAHPEIAEYCLPGSIEWATLENGDIPAIPAMRVSFVGLFVNEDQYKPAKNIGEMSMDEFIASLDEDDKFAFQTVNNAWTSMLFVTAILANQEGGTELLHEYEGKKLYDYNQQCIKDTMTIFKDVWQKHASDNSLGADYPDAINAMTSNGAAFISNGSWMNPQLEEGESANWSNGFNGENVSAYAFPGNIVIGGTKSYGRWFLTNGGSEKEREAARAFVEMIHTQEELEQWLLHEGGDIPGMDYSEEYLQEISQNKLLSEQSEAMAGDITLVCSLESIMPDSVANSIFGNLLTQLVNDDITVDQFCEQLTLKAEETRDE